MEGLSLLPKYGFGVLVLFGKVLSTQDRPTVGRLPLIVSYVLISLKASSTFIILESHTR